MINPKKRKHKGGGKKTQTNPVAMQVTMPAPQTIATQTIENRGTVAPTNFDYEEDSEPDSCPLVQHRCRKKQELRLITAAHRHYRGLVGLPFITPAFSYSESDSLPKPFPALELDSLAGYEQDTAQTTGHQIEQPGNEDTTMLFHEHQAQEPSPSQNR
ncbi:hypothetical protein F511_23839 [Dorcoceras hygrometricum]|uniref:Uncharacterized protein n=1 Tax=Dorcoceras hygrometricum TaxID=472368 RepID=A0A2Z7BFF4_9LAMI|nr:hypothetical protein F511_23839 [Dorcoceras hygrometricum]